MTQPSNAAQEELSITFINREPNDREWTAHIKLLNNWTTPDMYLRHIIQYARGGKFYPADMHVDLVEQIMTARDEAKRQRSCGCPMSCYHADVQEGM